jgi:hypothetical protein
VRTALLNSLQPLLLFSLSLFSCCSFSRVTLYASRILLLLSLSEVLIMFSLNFLIRSCLLSSFFILLLCSPVFAATSGSITYNMGSDEVRNDVQYFSPILGRWYYPGRAATA